VPGYESWWDVPIAEVSDVDAVQAARNNYVKAREKQRIF
jgi:3D-(3,5/4)-trihydroxycyclohexane-1,2-dione acylhydrolase (decyclizing)